MGALTVARLRQCVAAITERRLLEIRHERRRSEWEVRTICTFIASTVPVEEGKDHPLLDLVETIGKPATDPKGESPMGPSKAREPEAGSFERASMLLGMMAKGR